MRSSTRKADRARVLLFVLTFSSLGACSVPAAAVVREDHSTDAEEIHRALVSPVEDHSMDAIEAQRGRDYPH